MPNRIAKVVVAAATYAIDRPYDYRVPDSLADSLRPGMRVAVPFGKGNRVSDGIVLSIQEESGAEKRLKDIRAQLDQQPMLSSAHLQLALWMREQYFCTVYDAARVMLPAGLWFSLQDCLEIAPGMDREEAFTQAGSSKLAQRLLELLFSRDRQAELGQIRLAFGTSDPGPAIRMLEEAGVLVRKTSTARGIGDKTELIAQLVLPPEQALAAASSRRKRAPVQYAAVETLCGVGRVSAKELCYFTGATLATLRTLERAGILTLEKQEVYRRPQRPVVAPAPPPVLNEEQERAFRGLLALCRQGASAALLYGVTGSGKTQVYLRLIREVLDLGKTALVLVPEIALTPQVMELFLAHFGDQVAILHSALSAGERYDEWKRVRDGAASVVVGTRSAIFAPLPNLGVVILDEEQEPSYKSEQTPRYHARDVARYRCAKSNALLLLGSATPSVESMYHAKQGDYRLFQLTRRYNNQDLPAVSIVDMKDELRRGNGGVVSQTLAQQLEQCIQRGEQAILFLNRRGANRMVVCGECGQSPSCPRCSVHLTYHSSNRRLMCHYCGFSQPLPQQCPSCGGLLEFVGAGTQKAEEELQARFPGIEILRMDADTVSATKSHEMILERFRRKRVPILLGTQMVAKGLDFEHVTLVGALAADQGLYAEDFRAAERTFSLLTQVTGRAGRGSKAGQSVIQTYTPDNDVIQFAARQDYDSFYEQEIRMRQLRQFPPFGDLFVLGVSGPEEIAVLKACSQLRDALERALHTPPYEGGSYRVLGPSPAPILKVNNRYRYRMMFHGANTKQNRQLVAHLVRCAQQDKRNRGLSIYADFNPLD